MSKEAYSIQIRLDPDVRDLYDSFSMKDRDTIKANVNKQFMQELELCGEQGDEYEPLTIVEDTDN